MKLYGCEQVIRYSISKVTTFVSYHFLILSSNIELLDAHYSFYICYFLIIGSGEVSNGSYNIEATAWAKTRIPDEALLGTVG